MKTIIAISASVLVVAASAISSLAQDETAYVESSETPVVYQQPVIYQAPVVYQAAVAYYAPVYYVSAGADPSQCAPPVCSEPAARSTVLVIGAHGGTYEYSNDRCSDSSVIYVGGNHHQPPARRYRR